MSKRLKGLSQLQRMKLQSTLRNVLEGTEKMNSALRNVHKAKLGTKKQNFAIQNMANLWAVKKKDIGLQNLLDTVEGIREEAAREGSGQNPDLVKDEIGEAISAWIEVLPYENGKPDQRREQRDKRI